MHAAWVWDGARRMHVACAAGTHLQDLEQLVVKALDEGAQVADDAERRVYRRLLRAFGLRLECLVEDDVRVGLQQIDDLHAKSD
jgi:hypothetical protein